MVLLERTCKSKILAMDTHVTHNDHITQYVAYWAGAYFLHLFNITAWNTEEGENRKNAAAINHWAHGGRHVWGMVIVAVAWYGN